MASEIYMALVLGLVGGVIPGPVLAACFTESLLHGFWKSMRIIFWALLIETIVAIVSLLVFSTISFPQWFFQGLSVLGAFMLLWIAWSVWKIKKIDTQTKVVFSPGKIALMIFANGVLWTYWISVCIPKAISLGEKISGGSLWFVLLVEAGWLVSTIVVVYIFSRFRNLLRGTKTFLVVSKMLALAFVYFALDILYDSISFFIKLM